MQIELKPIKIREITKDYADRGENGVFGFSGKLNIRPPYQREFIYKDKQRNAVMDTVRKGFPLNIIYWSVNADNQFEVMDGQQRTLSICQYVNGEFSIEQLPFEEMEADHIIPWSQGGKTTPDNCQMVSKLANRRKSDS